MIKHTCKQCGKEFTMADSEIRFYKEKNLQLPKRCKDCRQKNKNKNKRERSQQSSQCGSGSYHVTTSAPNNDANSTATKKGRLHWSYLLGLLAVVMMIYFLNDFGFFGSNSKSGLKTEEALQSELAYSFRSDSYLQEHFEKHGIEMGYKDSWEYLEAANNVIEDASSLHKLEQEDGDDVYYLESTNDFVIVSTDGFIRTYFRPEDGIEYYNRQ